MSDNEFSDAELIGMLGTYADALEQHTTVTPGLDEPGQIDDLHRGGSAQAKGEDMESEVVEPTKPDVVELDVVPTPKAESNRGRVLVAAAVVSVVAVIGALFAFTGDESGLDTAESVAVEEAEDEAAEDGSAEASSATDEAVDPVDSDATDSQAAESDAVPLSGVPGGFNGPGSVVFVDGEFVSIGADEDGHVLSRSPNGTDWTTERVDGLPENSMTNQLLQVDGRWVTVVEVWPIPEEDESGEFFEFGATPERFVATSDDLTSWDLVDFPDVGLEEHEFGGVVTAAVSGDLVAIGLQISPEGTDELEILVENDLITREQLNTICGSEYTDDEGPVIFYECPEPSFEEDVEESGDAVDPFGDQVELLRVEPGDPGYDELVAPLTSEQLPRTVVVTGPVDGPFEATDLPFEGFGTTIAGTDAGFVAISSGFDGLPESSSSVDGVTWSEPTEVGEFFGVSSASASGDRVVIGVQQGLGSGFGVLWSDDLGATWTEATIATELFSPWGEIVSGPAGFAVQLQGSPSAEAASPFGDIQEVSIDKDGYTLTVQLIDFTLTLTGPEGVVIHDNVGEELFFRGEIENVARTEGSNDETIVWLDPETGEELVRFEEDQLDAAFDELEPDFDEDFEDFEQASEVWYSVDGETWTLVEVGEATSPTVSFSMVAAVGDDEVLIRTEQFVEPPDELLGFEREGREPTEEEIAVLDDWFAEIGSGGEWTAIPVPTE